MYITIIKLWAIHLLKKNGDWSQWNSKKKHAKIVKKLLKLFELLETYNFTTLLSIVNIIINAATYLQQCFTLIDIHTHKESR